MESGGAQASVGSLGFGQVAAFGGGASQPVRCERLIARCRAAFSLLALLALWLHPTEPSRFSQLAYSLTAAYAAVALVLALWAARVRVLPAQAPIVVHVLDLGFLSLIILVTEGTTSPFVTAFTFVLAAGALRWRQAGTLWTAVAAFAVLVVIAALSRVRWIEADFELNRFIIRTIQLVVVAVLIGYLSAYESRLRRGAATIAQWPALVARDADALLPSLLGHAASALRAPRAVLAWEEAEEPLWNLAHWDGSSLEWRRESARVLPALAPASLAAAAFAVGPRASGGAWRVLVRSGTSRCAEDPLPGIVRAHAADAPVLSVPVAGETFAGRLFLVGVTDVTTDDLVLAEIVAPMLAVRMDQRALLERDHREELAGQRIALARDLHDGVIQSLAAAALRLESARTLLQAQPATADSLIGQTQELLQEEQRALRRIAVSLEPRAGAAVPPPADLSSRLEALAGHVERHWGLRVGLDNALGGTRLGSELEHQLCCLVQEALVNAARHGGASMAQVRVSVAGDAVRLQVDDDGRGFAFVGRYDLPMLAAAGLGPVSLRERIASLAGRLLIDSGPTGARLDMVLPVRLEATA